ncbi:reverse transcriptase family protein [Niallia sp. FSL R7-0648]|uniref:reverse transcriptase family protein n=1 Tax=Niallia sp. FSL R7-0648 TaxID=2954521 RepID=UPI0030FC851F
MIIIFIFKEDFFYNYILQDTIENIKNELENKNESYYTRVIPKKGTDRILNCLKKESKLHTYQTNLKDRFLNNIPIPDNVYGFVKDRSYKEYLIPHIRLENEVKYYIRIDIKNFFPSINNEIIEEVIKYYFKTDELKSKEMIDVFLNIVSLNNALPQGAVTSPVISNIVFRQIDLRIQKYCRKTNVTYTRYADDLLFSSNNKRILEKFFINMIRKILKSKGFNLNNSKLITTTNEIVLNGFVVGSDIRLSRSKKRDLNTILYVYNNLKPSSVNELLSLLNSKRYINRKLNKERVFFSSKYALLNYLSGSRSFLIEWQATKKKTELDSSNIQLLNRLEKLIINIDKLN